MSYVACRGSLWCNLYSLKNQRTMMETHEFVVPKSIPITSPASALDDCHRIERTACAVAEDRKVEAVVSPLRKPNCKDMFTRASVVVFLVYLCLRSRRVSLFVKRARKIVVGEESDKIAGVWWEKEMERDRRRSSRSSTANKRRARGEKEAKAQPRKFIACNQRIAMMRTPRPDARRATYVMITT